MLSLEGCIVTADALHCSRPLPQRCSRAGGDYVLALKKNQGKLFNAVARRFARRGKRSVAVQREPSTHDRHEARRATVIRDTSLGVAHSFPGVAALAASPRADACMASAPRSRSCATYLLSKYMSAKRLLQVVRSHWGIENQLHWVLDVVFAEDANRARKDNAPENLAILRRLALNIIRIPPRQHIHARKIKRAGWDNAFLIELISHMR